MTPSDDTAAARANRTAAEWIAQLLEPAKDQPVAVIVLWPEPRSDSFFSVPSRPLFLLAKGELVNDRYVFRHIIFGDPLEAAR